MPNAKDAIAAVNETFLLTGNPGSGKTAQLATLPGRKFLYNFDPGSIATLRGQDIEFESFLPDVLKLDISPLSDSARKKAAKIAPKDLIPVAYENWEKDFYDKIRSGFFANIDVIGFDSLTTFSDVVMDNILYMNGRYGQFPQQDDYAPQMVAISNVFRTLNGMGKTILVTAHEELIKDEQTGRVTNQILVTGKLRVRLPLLFTEILRCECKSTPKEEKFIIQTRPDRLGPYVRCTMRGLEMYEDVTIKDWNKPGEYGLGKILKNTSR